MSADDYRYVDAAEMHRMFYDGVPIADIAKARDCSISRAKELIKNQRLEYQYSSMRSTIQDLAQFDRMLVKLDPSGTSATTMAYLQPMRKFLEQIT